MTCIVAIETQDGVWMGSDRLASGHTVGTVYDAAKVFRRDDVLVGSCGSVRLKQLLRYSVDIPVEELTWDMDRWMTHHLAAAIRSAFSAHGFDYSQHGVSGYGGEFLFAIRGRCYEVQSDYSWIRSATGEYAVGSGAEVALGSLHSTRMWADPEDRVRAALEAAAEHVVSVAGPFDIEFQGAP